MKTTLIALAIAFSGSAFGTSIAVDTHNLKYTDSNWYLAMINVGCGTSVSKEGGFVGAVVDKGDYVTLTASKAGKVLVSMDAASAGFFDVQYGEPRCDLGSSH